MSRSPHDSFTQEVDPETLNTILTAANQASLEPLHPDEALEMYISSREGEVASSTRRTHRSRLSFFTSWCKENGIENLNDLTGRDLQQYRDWRKEDLSVLTLKSNMRTLRLFLQKCVKYDAVPPALPTKVDVPGVTDADHARDDIVPGEVATQILDHLGKFEYARIDHIVWLLLVEAGLRTCSLHSLDVDDFEATEDGGELSLKHRPQSSTRLKNKEKSERLVHISEHAATVIQDYLIEHRPNVTDDFGRNPLLASKHGRLCKTTIRKYVYKWTRPCIIQGSCPDGLSPDEFDECRARKTSSDAYQCPASKSPHAVRRGYLTSELDAGIPKPVLADRCDVTPQVIDDYYDKRSPEDTMRLRKEIRESVYRDGDTNGYGRE